MTKAIDITPHVTPARDLSKAKWKVYVRQVPFRHWLQRVSVSRIHASGTEIVELEDGWNNKLNSGFLISDIQTAQRWLAGRGWLGEVVEVIIKE